MKPLRWPLYLIDFEGKEHSVPLCPYCADDMCQDLESPKPTHIPPDPQNDLAVCSVCGAVKGLPVGNG